MNLHAREPAGGEAMIITTIKSSYEPAFRAITENPRYVSGYPDEARKDLGLEKDETVVVPLVGPFNLAQSLPQGAELRRADGSEAKEFETVKIVVQELFLPVIAELAPVTKPFVTGVQAIWITVDLLKELSQEEIDATETTIKSVRLANKAVDALLTLQGATGPAMTANRIAGLCIATADKLYVARLSDEERGLSKRRRTKG
jgi:hypothetical protein